MARHEGEPGFGEKWSYRLRNAEAVAAGIFLYFGHLGAAALMAAGAVIDHAIGGYLKNRRLQAA